MAKRLILDKAKCCFNCKNFIKHGMCGVIIGLCTLLEGESTWNEVCKEFDMIGG